MMAGFSWKGVFDTVPWLYPKNEAILNVFPALTLTETKNPVSLFSLGTGKLVPAKSNSHTKCTPATAAKTEIPAKRVVKKEQRKRMGEAEEGAREGTSKLLDQRFDLGRMGVLVTMK